jgi:hypothetical protein
LRASCAALLLHFALGVCVCCRLVPLALSLTRPLFAAPHRYASNIGVLLMNKFLLTNSGFK